METKRLPPVHIGERVLWLGSSSGIPQGGIVRWIGNLPEIVETGKDWTIGLRLDRPVPFGGIDGTWGNRQLFECEPRHGLLVPASRILREEDLFHNMGVTELLGNNVYRPRRRTRRQRSGLTNVSVNRRSAVIRIRADNIRSSHDISWSSDEYNFGHDISDSRGQWLRASNHAHRITMSRSEDQSCSSKETDVDKSLDDSIDAVEARYSEQLRRHLDSRRIKSGVYSGEPRPSSSGFFSFLRWFKRGEKNAGDSGSDSCSVPASPVLIRSASSSCDSIDSIFSTATAASFAFVPPTSYKPFGGASPPEKCIAPGPDTDTYRRRLRQRDRLRELDKNLTLRKKYRLLYLNDTLKSENVSGAPDSPIGDAFGRKKLKITKTVDASDEHREYSDLSLPNVKHRKDDLSESYEAIAVRKHRRTVSDSSKDKKAGAYCHVKGKRRAPPPPANCSSNSLSVGSLTGSDRTLTRSPASTAGRKKRPAPQPPSSPNQEREIRCLGNTTDEDRQLFNNNKFIADSSRGMESPALSTSSKERLKFFEDIVSNDSLKLERGVLKSTKENIKIVDTDMGKEIKVIMPSPVSPKPWYKRKDGHNHFKKDKTIEKRKEKRGDTDNFPEVGFSRNSTLFEGASRFSFFSKSDDKKKDNEKRKSGVPILPNISELDRQAAEIVNKEHAREQAKAAAHDDQFYNIPDFLRPKVTNEMDDDEPPKRQSTRELISRFNELTNVTKVTVNTAFRDSPFFSKSSSPKKVEKSLPIQKTTSEKLAIQAANNKVPDIKIIDTPVKENDTPPMKRSIFSTSFQSTPPSSSITLEDIENDLGSRAQARFNANRTRRPSSPTISTIIEQSESSTPMTNSTRSSVVIPASIETQKNVWVCSRCTLENSKWKGKCDACDMLKPLTVEDSERLHQSNSSVDSGQIKVTSKKSGIDWEIAIRKYFPQKESSPLKKSASETSVPSKPKIVEVLPKAQNIKSTCVTIVENGINDVPEVKPVALNDLSCGQSGSAEPNIEEVRKARLARFSANLDDPIKDNNIDETEEEEQQRLFQMLKDMKNSLPKRPKSIKMDEGLQKKVDDVKKILNEPKNEPLSEKQIKETESKKFGAIKKLFKPKESPKKSSDIIIITKETIIEDIKVKKENVNNEKPIKVSSSCQTSAIIRKTDPPLTEKVNGVVKEEVILPITVEEMPTSGIKVGNRTYELIRPRDFADIKAVKTENENKLGNVYANVPPYENIDTKAPAKILNTDKGVITNGNASSEISEELDKLTAELTLPRGIANFKEGLKRNNAANTNTLAINRLLRSLETAIAGGEHVEAARLAKDLAHMKVTCSVIRQKTTPPKNTFTISVDLYVEDQISHQGPITIQVVPTITVAELKEKIAREFEIPVGVQRWILGKELASDDLKTLEEHKVVENGCSIYLYLVAPDGGDIEESDSSSQITNGNGESISNMKGMYYNEEDDTYSYCESELTSETDNEEIKDNSLSLDEAVGGAPKNFKVYGTLKLGWKCTTCTLINSPSKSNCALCPTKRPDTYIVPKEYPSNVLMNELMNLDNTDLVPNLESFNCPVCFDRYEQAEGVILRECLHTFCKDCLINTVQFNDEAEVKCPYRDEQYACDSVLQEREIKALVPADTYEQHLSKSIAQAENRIKNAFHCKTPNCVGWCIFEENVNYFYCPVCSMRNCLTCQAIHSGLDCQQYQNRIREDTSPEARSTRDMLQEMVDKGEAMTCPTCEVVLMKKWGCDWLRCSMCKTEICWVTRGPRWGPAGKGDVSGGCKCGVDGKKCHAKCNYCH